MFIFSRIGEMYVARELLEITPIYYCELNFLRGSWELEISEQKLWGQALSADAEDSANRCSAPLERPHSARNRDRLCFESSQADS